MTLKAACCVVAGSMILATCPLWARDTACGMLPSIFPEPGLNIYGVEEDRGRVARVQELEFSLSLREGKQVQVFQDILIIRYLETLLGRLLKHAPAYAKEFSYTFYLYNNEKPNAIAIPGGAVVVSLGEIIETPSDDATAFTLAHEIAHIALRHGTRVQTLEVLYIFEEHFLRRISLGSKSFSLTAEEKRNLGALQKDVSARLAGLDRIKASNELEADYFSAVIGAEAGFNPASTAQEYFEDAKRQGRGWSDWASHPHSFLRGLVYKCEIPPRAPPEGISLDLTLAKEQAIRLLRQQPLPHDTVLPH